MALALAAAGASAQETRIIVITHGQASDTFWSVVKNGVDDAAELMGVEVQYQAPQTFDMVAMAQLIDAAVASKPDGLVVSIPDADALGDSIRAAVAAGIPVVSMDSGLDVSKELGALLHMGIDEYPSGFAAGEKMKALGKTNGACVNMEVGNVALDQRCQGFADALDGNVAGDRHLERPDRDQGRRDRLSHAAPRDRRRADRRRHRLRSDAGRDRGSGPRRSDRARLVRSVAHHVEAIDQGRALFGIDAQQYLTGYYPVIFLTIYDRYGMIPVNDVLTGPLVRHQGHRQAGDRAQRPGLPLIAVPS